jgi:hypothetical protein
MKITAKNPALRQAAFVNDCIVAEKLLESTILKMWKEYTLKTIDENNRKLPGNNATMIGNIQISGHYVIERP